MKKIANHYIITDSDTGRSFTFSKEDITPDYDWNSLMRKVFKMFKEGEYENSK